LFTVVFLPVGYKHLFVIKGNGSCPANCVMPCLCGTYHTRLVHTATNTFITLLVKQKYYIQIGFVCRSFRSVHSDVRTGNRHWCI